MSGDGSTPGGGASAGDSEATASDVMPGQVIDGRYRVTAKLGEGGMGEVYAAEHVHIEKRVAIKLLRKEILTNQEAVQRFRQEARSASSIGHRNIIEIEDFGALADGRIYLCMELLDGAPLSDLLKSGLPPDRGLSIVIQTCHGLAAAHAKGITHRDMKPENIFVTTGDVPKLLDFGIAKVSQAEGGNNLTRTGAIFGTPYYMSPEQALGHPVDHRADIYAMGVIIYEMFCGRVPFQGESFMGILSQHISVEAPAPTHVALEQGRQLPAGIEVVIATALRKNQMERYQSMTDLVNALVPIYRSVAGAGMSSYIEVQRTTEASAASASSSMHPMQVSSPGLPAATTSKRKTAWLLFATTVVVAALVGGIAAIVLTGDENTAHDGSIARSEDAIATASLADARTHAMNPDAAVTIGPTDARGSNQQFDAPLLTPDATSLADAAATRPDAAAVVAVQLIVRPAFAWIRVDGKVLPRGRRTIHVARGKHVVVRVGARGYKTKRVRVSGKRPRVHVRLQEEGLLGP